MSAEDADMGNVAGAEAKSATSQSAFPYTEPEGRASFQRALENVRNTVRDANNYFAQTKPAVFRQTNAREALIWMLRKDAASHVQIGVEDKEFYTDLLKYIVYVAKLTKAGDQTAKQRAVQIVDEMKKFVSKMDEPLDKEPELEEVKPGDTHSEASESNEPLDVSGAPYREFYRNVALDLYGDGKALAPYRGADEKQHELLEFGNVRENVKTGKVLATVRNLVQFVRDNRDYLPYLYAVKAAEGIYPELKTDRQSAILFAQTVSAVVAKRADKDAVLKVALELNQGRLTAETLPIVSEISKEIAARKIEIPVLVRLAEALSRQGISLDELTLYKESADERLRMTRELEALRQELKSERENLALRSVIHTALEKFASESRANEKLVFEVLRDDGQTFQRLEDLYKIYQFAKGRAIRIDDLWKLLDEYRTLDSKLKLLENKENIRRDIVELQTLLDDNLLQPKTTLQLLRSLLSDSDTANIGAVTDTIRRLKQRNSELSSSFRLTLVAMGSLLQVFNSVSQKYAFHVLEFVRGFSAKVVATTQAWGLQADNPVAQLAEKLAKTFVERYYVEVKVDQKMDTKTLELTFNGQQNLNLTTDAVFLRSASLFRWLDQFIVDPKRPTDVDMAKLWDQAAEHLYDWQQQVITTFGKTDVAGPSRPVDTITNGLLSANSQFFSRVNDALRKTTEIAQNALDRFGKDMKTQDDSWRRRVEYLLVSPALGQYALTINGQDAKTQEAARAIFRAFIDATRTQLLDGKQDDLDSTKIMAQMNDLAFDIGKLRLEAGSKDVEYKRLQSDHKALETKYDAVEKANDASVKKIKDAERELLKYATNVGVTLQPDLVDCIKGVLDIYEKNRLEFVKTAALVSAMANKYQVSANVQGASLLLSVEMKAVLDVFAAKYDNWDKASKKLTTLSISKLFPGGHQPTTDLEKDVEVVLTAFRQTLADWEKVQVLVSNYSLQVFEGKVNMTGVLETDADKAFKAYERYRQDFVTLRDDEDKWWTDVQLVRYPGIRNLTDDEKVERGRWTTLLSTTTGVLPLLAQRRNVVTGWIKALADLIDENDMLTVKDLINKAQGKPSSKGSSASASTTPAAAHSNPYYRVKFNGEVDTLSDKDKFPVFLPQTPFMRLWMFARVFAGAASNQLGNILEPLAPGLEIEDERTLFILREYQNNHPKVDAKDPTNKDIPNPTLPTGASRVEVAKQHLADEEEKKDLKETAEERRKKQQATALDYIEQLDKYKNLDEYEIKVRQYFKNIALNALVHCQEMLQRTDLPEFRRITLAELINSSNLSAGFARMCGLYTLIKQGTVPGMISTQSSEANRAQDFLNHARDLPRMYRRKGPYVWEVVRVPSSSSPYNNNGDSINKRLRL